MSSAQFRRVYALTIGPPGGIGKTWTDLRLTFEVKRDAGGKPNTAKIQLYNLDPASRSIVETTGAFVTLLAGYGLVPSLIFRGDISKRGVKVERDGPTRVVTLEAGDGELSWRDARFDQSFGPGTPNSTIMTALLAVMGHGIGPGVPLPPVVYGSGVTFFGPARNALTQLANDAGVFYSVQDGLVEFLAPGVVTNDGAALLSPATGLIGAPTATKNGINAKSLLNPMIRPGRFVSLASESYQGFYKALKVTHKGETYGGDWVTETEAVPVEGAA